MYPVNTTSGLYDVVSTSWSFRRPKDVRITSWSGADVCWTSIKRICLNKTDFYTKVCEDFIWTSKKDV